MCDDGNNVDGDGCSANCQTIEYKWTCVNGYLDKTNCTYVPCGNEIFDGISVPKGVTVNEQCDDGNVINGDGCSSTCVVEPFYFCSNYGLGTCTKMC